MTNYRGHHYIGAWHYVLLDILYCIPLVGWIFLLIHAFSPVEENRRHYARSYFVRLFLLLLILGISAAVVYFVSGPEGLKNIMAGIEEEYHGMIR